MNKSAQRSGNYLFTTGQTDDDTTEFQDGGDKFEVFPGRCYRFDLSRVSNKTWITVSKPIQTMEIRGRRYNLIGPAPQLSAEKTSTIFCCNAQERRLQGTEIIHS